MALALLAFDGPTDGRIRFRLDLGTNRYYAYAVGGEDRIRRHGLEVLAEPTFKSPLLGPLPDASRGRGFLEITPEVFDRENRYVQLLSYRTADMVGPAISEPVRVPVGGRAREDLPTLSFGANMTRSTLHSSVPETVPIRFREVRPEHSQTLFLGALMGALPSILPAVAPLVGNLLGGLTGGGSSSRGGSSTPGAGGAGGFLSQLQRMLQDPGTARLFADLIQQVAGAASGGSVGGGGSSPSAPATASSLSARVERLRGLPTTQVYSEAQVAPALLAALPALMPLLQQVLNPQTVQAIIDQPNRMTGTVINGLKDMARLGIESHEQDLRHLRELNPGVDDPALDALLQSLSLSLSGRSPELHYRRVTSVRLRFQPAPTTSLHGRDRLLYRHGRSLAFPVAVETPRTIRKGVLQLLVKDPESLAILGDARIPVEDVAAGPLPVSPSLTAEQSSGLKPGEDYLICVALVWKNGDGKPRGSSVQQLVTLVSEYGFDRVEEGSRVVALSDPTVHRDYWHRIWKGPFTREFKRRELNCAYYYLLKPDRRDPARMEVEVGSPREEDGRRKANLRTGTELSLEGLNQLLSLVAPGEPRLSPAELEALRARDFVERVNAVARFSARLRGRPDDQGALWVYPEVKLQRLILKRAAQVDGNGLVTGFEDHPVVFPVPVVAHFVGLRSGNGAGTEVVFEGMKTLFDDKVGLAPAQVQPRRSTRRGS